MFTCEVCDGESFYDELGQYFCSTCGTQSQEYQVEEKQEVDLNQPVNMGLKLRKKKERKRKQRVVSGKPWVIHEALQCLLKAQVEALVEMGFNSKLKDVVGQLWFGFLQKKGVAFCDEEPATISMDCQKHTGRHPNVRTLPSSIKRSRQQLLFGDEDSDEKMEADLLEEQKTEIKTEVAEEGSKKSGEVIDPFLKRLDEEMDQMSEDIFSQEQQYNSSSTPTTSSTDSDDDGKSVGSVGSLKMKKESRLSTMLKFQQLHTICFCYIGLVYLEEPVLINDLVRWAREGTLPYHKAVEVLPPEMKFSYQDNKLFHQQRNPSIQHVFKTCQRLVKYLGVKVKFTKEMSKITAAALVLDLGYQESIFLLVSRLMKAIGFSCDLHQHNAIGTVMDSPMSIDAFIAAFVMIAVKLVYYVDDKHEFQDLRRQWLLAKLNIPPVEMTWKQWVALSITKRRQLLLNGIPKTDKDLDYIKNLDTYALYCTREVFGSFSHRETTRMYNRGITRMENAFNTDAKDRYYNVFSKITNELNPDFDDEIDRVSSSFPCSISLQGKLATGNQPVDAINQPNDTLETVSQNCECNNDKKDYLAFWERTNEKSRLDSYHYLIEVVSDRVDVPIDTLEPCVAKLEKKLFEEETVVW